MSIEIVSIIFAFITGGGLSTLINLKFARKGAEIDITDKAVKFWEGQFNTITDRHIALETKYEELKSLIEERAPLICYNAPTCLKRKRIELKP